MRWVFALFLSVLFYGQSINSAFADEEARDTAKVDSQKTSVKKSKKAKKKANPNREKETEGTEALHRFEADTVIHSHYERGGQPLEVDPD